MQPTLEYASAPLNVGTPPARTVSHTRRHFLLLCASTIAGCSIGKNATDTTAPQQKAPFEMPKPDREFEVVTPGGQKFKAKVFEKLPADTPADPPQKKERVCSFGQTKDGQLLQADLSGSDILIVNPETHRTTHTIKTPQTGIFRLEFSIDGTLIVSMDATNVIVWEVASGMQKLKIEAAFEPGETIVMSEDNEVVGVMKLPEGGEAVIRKWDVKTGKPIDE